MDLRQNARTYYGNRNLQDSDIKLDRIKAKPTSAPVWSNIQDLSNDQAKEVEVKVTAEPGQQRGAEKHSTLNIANNMIKINIKISMNRVVKGLNRPLKVPLHPDLSMFGDEIDVYLEKSSFEESKYVPFSLLTSKRLEGGQTSNSAIVTIKNVHRRANFNLKAQLSGQVVIMEPNGGIEFDIRDMMDTSIDVSGTVEFQLQNHESVQYRN